MLDQTNVQLPRITPPLFTIDPSQTGGRKSRTGLEFQDQYTAYILAEFFAGREAFFAARIEAVEDVEVIVRTELGWTERYYQIKSRQEGTGQWTLASLNKEGVWARFFSLYRLFLAQKFEVSRQLELVIVVEGDFARDVVELREKGPQATNAKAALLPILTAVIPSQEPGSSSSEEVAEVLFDGFIACLRFESRVTNLQELTFNRFIRSADLSPNEAQNAISRLLAAIKAESLLKLATLVTPEILKDWLGLPDRSILQHKPVPDPYDVDRKDLLAEVAGRSEKANALVLDGVPKIGKSHLISRLIDESKMDHSYFWFTFAGGDADKDRFVFQLAHWVGQRTSVWGTKDDIQRGHLQPIQAIERLAKTSVGAVLLVLDDCHKANDQAFLAEMLRLLAEGWPEAKIIFVSEERLAGLRLSGIPEMTVKGLEPKEGLDLLRKLHIDVRGAIVELGLLCVQADGHPVLLRAIAKELSERPSPAEVTKLSTGLLSTLSVQPFLQVLSERLVKSLKTDSHRVWLTRLASVTFPFRRALALEIAHLEPPITVSIVDWNYLTSQILDASGAEQYTVPPLLRPLLTSEGQEPNNKLILVTAARHVFRNARASSYIDFWDFQGAILALVMAERYEEAAMRFSFSLRALLDLGSFSILELLFTVLNGDFVQAKLVDPFARFLLLLSEIQLRIQNEAQTDYSRIVDLLRKIRVLPKAELTPKGFVNIRTTTHAVISMVQVRRIKDAGTFSVRQGRRAFAALQTALRMAVPENDQDFLRLVLGLYDKLHTLEKQPDLELLKRAILTASLESKEISDDALVGIYAQFVISKKYDDSSLTLCEQHSREYRAAQRGGPFFACEHAIATILHDRFSQYNEARERVSAACTAALALGASHDVLGRTELLLADSYWAENQYANSAKHYERCLPIPFQDEALNQWVRERLADCLILLNEFHQATQHLVTTIRKWRTVLSADYKARLYARLVYAYGLNRELLKSAIACQGLSAIARASGSAQIDILCATLCDWLLQYFDYSDPVIPRSSAQIKNSSALSDKYTAEQVSAWEARGPLFARALVLLGMIFELLQNPVRAEFFYRKGLAIFQADGKATPGSGEGLFFALRICRTQIKQKRFPQVASYFASATRDLFAARSKETPTATEAAAAFAAFTFVEPALQSLPDSELVECFAALESQFNDKAHARAWMLFREVELFFERFLVQKGKSKLLEAEALAVDFCEPELLLQIRHKKLFVRFEQMYLNQIDWLSDVLEEALRLGSDGSLASGQETLGKSVLIIAQRMAKGPMRDIALKISGYGERWSNSPFIFSLLAIWTVSRHYKLRIAALEQIENLLRSTSNVLKEEDFS